MDWIRGMQNVIQYIEDNITEKLDSEIISKQAFVSSFHFQRAFSILCGFSLGEYPALVCAGVISAADCFRLVKARGAAMQRSAERMREGIPLPPGTVIKLIEAGKDFGVPIPEWLKTEESI